MIKAEKNGHKHEFSQEVWERMGKGPTRMGWTEVSEIAAPVEVLELKKKEPVVKEIKSKTAEIESEVEETDDLLEGEKEEKNPKKDKKK